MGLRKIIFFRHLLIRIPIIENTYEKFRKLEDVFVQAWAELNCVIFYSFLFLPADAALDPRHRLQGLSYPSGL